MCCVDISALLPAVKLNFYGSRFERVLFLSKLSSKQKSNMFIPFVKTTQTEIIPDYSMYSSKVYPSR